MASKLDGGPINQIHLNLMMYGEIDPEFPRMSPEDRQAMARMFEACMPKPVLPVVGQVMIFGTAGEMDECEDLEKMFYNPEASFNLWTDPPPDDVPRYFIPANIPEEQ